MYRWVDEQGKVHFSQMPPPPASESKVTELRSHSIQIISNPNSPEQDAGTVSRQTTSDNAQQSVQNAVANALEEAELKHKCAQQRNTLNTLNAGLRVKVVSPDGSIHWVSDKERAQQLKEASNFLHTHCQ